MQTSTRRDDETEQHCCRTVQVSQSPSLKKRMKSEFPELARDRDDDEDNLRNSRPHLQKKEKKSNSWRVETRKKNDSPTIPVLRSTLANS